MWMNEYIAARSGNREGTAIGQVGDAVNGRVSVSATRDYHRLPMLLPAGIVCIPTQGAPTVVMETPGGAVCAGVITQPPDDLKPGELMLSSAGGATVVLKNDGRVLINGREVQ